MKPHVRRVSVSPLCAVVLSFFHCVAVLFSISLHLRLQKSPFLLGSLVTNLLYFILTSHVMPGFFFSPMVLRLT
jgi:hypothetical protein